jgi:hypothetical protein
VFHRIRRATGERFVWLRATGSTAVSQLVDSFVVLYIAFVLGPQQWPTSLFMADSTVNYAYKMLAAIALIPLLYLMRMGIHRYLGADRAAQLREHAAEGRLAWLASGGPGAIATRLLRSILFRRRRAPSMAFSQSRRAHHWRVAVSGVRAQTKKGRQAGPFRTTDGASDQARVPRVSRRPA